MSAVETIARPLDGEEGALAIVLRHETTKGAPRWRALRRTIVVERYGVTPSTHVQ